MQGKAYYKILLVGTISFLLTVSFMGTSELNAQETNATNATGASTVADQTTVVMPLGSSGATSGVGYEPPEVAVSPGSTVVWDNQDNALHTATSGVSPNPDGKFDTGLLSAGQKSVPITMPNVVGEHPYFCTLHPFLTGTVSVG